MVIVCARCCFTSLQSSYRRLRVDDTTAPQARSVESGAAVAGPPDTRQQVPERDVQLDWQSRAPCVPSCQRPPHTALVMAVLGAEHVPRHTDKRVKIPGGVRGSCDLFKVQQALCQLHCMFHRLLPFWRVWQNWRFYLWGVFTFVFEVDVELKREQPPAPTARSESKY